MVDGDAIIMFEFGRDLCKCEKYMYGAGTKSSGLIAFVLCCNIGKIDP